MRWWEWGWCDVVGMGDVVELRWGGMGWGGCGWWLTMPNIVTWQGYENTTNGHGAPKTHY